jgi:hypothetical protein
MGDTFRGTAIPLTNQRTDRMILIVSMGLVFALVVGGFVMAVNNDGDCDQELVDVQLIKEDGLDPVEIAQQQYLGLPDFVMESESGCWGPLCTEQGYIDFVGDNLPDLLPLCIDNDYLAQWYVDIIVYGGYKPWMYGSYIDVWQKGEYKGTIDITWTWTGKGECCAYDYYRATFSVVEKICLESNQYPDVDPWTLTVDDGYRTIPGKCVNFEIYTYWTGCEPGVDPSQDFTIIHSQSFWLSQRDSSSFEYKYPNITSGKQKPSVILYRYTLRKIERTCLECVISSHK